MTHNGTHKKRSCFHMMVDMRIPPGLSIYSSVYKNNKFGQHFCISFQFNFVVYIVYRFGSVNTCIIVIIFICGFAFFPSVSEL